MIETTTLTPLGHKILEHWRRHRPTMVENLTNANQLQQAVFAAQELTGNLLYELTVVQKMDCLLYTSPHFPALGAKFSGN